MFLTDHGGIEYGHGGVSTNEMIVPFGDHRSGNTQRVRDHGTQYREYGSYDPPFV